MVKNWLFLDLSSQIWDIDARMLDLNDHHYFVHAVDHGGFAAASRALGLPKSTISRRVIELESRLGVRLIERAAVSANGPG